jgi:hypothetical protein
VGKLNSFDKNGRTQAGSKIDRQSVQSGQTDRTLQTSFIPFLLGGGGGKRVKCVSRGDCNEEHSSDLCHNYVQ